MGRVKKVTFWDLRIENSSEAVIMKHQKGDLEARSRVWFKREAQQKK
jgi:hypothetical protein